jgi:hypothetical protein
MAGALIMAETTEKCSLRHVESNGNKKILKINVGFFKIANRNFFLDTPHMCVM